MTADCGVEGLTYRNSYNFPYPETYTVIPYAKGAKVARIMMYPMISIGNAMTKEVWPVDPRSLCLQQLKELKAMGYSLFSAFEHEFQVIDKSTDRPLWQGTEFCNTNKFALNEELAFTFDKYLYQMGIDLEMQHVEYSPGQYEFPMKPAWGIYGADNSFTFRNAIKQIAQQKNYLATFATTPFPANMKGASNGAHFNFSIWSEQKQPQDTTDDYKTESNQNKTNALYDAKSENKLSDTAMYFIGGILEHINAMTIFANITPNCYRRSNTHAWAPGNVSWGRFNRSVLVRVKTDGQKTYFEYRLSPSACNPYLVTASVIAAGIDGIRNKTKPKYKECTKYAWNEEYKHLPKLPADMQSAIEGLKKDKIIWNAFGDRFCNMLISTKETELKELEALAKDIGQEAAETKMFLNL